jgi:four helix bundle protein
MGNGREFWGLTVWKKARAFRKKVNNLVREFPEVEKYRLRDQLIRSSRSVTANIAEGHGRFHYQENIQFCRQARGSLSECLDHLICAYDCGLLTEEELLDFKEDFKEVERLLNGYIGYLIEQKKKR